MEGKSEFCLMHISCFINNYFHSPLIEQTDEELHDPEA